MESRIFEDLVVSSPSLPLGRRVALLPLSLAVHAAALGMALLVPVWKASELPEPATRVPLPIIERTVLPSPPPIPTRTPPVRVHGGSRSAAPPVELAVARPAAMPPTEELPLVPDADPAPPVCLKDCGVATADGPPDVVGSTGPGDGTGAGPRTVRAGGVIEPPARIAYAAPVYPPIAQSAGVGGIVVLDCTIAPDGRVVDVRILSGHPLLNEAAVNAVRQWRYRATRLDGVPVAVLMTVTVRFLPHR